MSRRLENIVRPFETPKVTPPQRIFAPYQTTIETTALTLGKNGRGKIMNGSYNSTLTVYLDTILREKAEDA
jgi:hypothetical protein